MSIKIEVPSDGCYTVTFPPTPDISAIFSVNSDGVTEVLLEGLGTK